MVTAQISVANCAVGSPTAGVDQCLSRGLSENRNSRAISAGVRKESTQADLAERRAWPSQICPAKTRIPESIQIDSHPFNMVQACG
jgi:hypothetical protein